MKEIIRKEGIRGIYAGLGCVVLKNLFIGVGCGVGGYIFLKRILE